MMTSCQAQASSPGIDVCFLCAVIQFGGEQIVPVKQLPARSCGFTWVTVS